MTKRKRVFARVSREVSKTLPYELIDMVLLELDSLKLALYLKRSWISKSIYQPYVNNMTIASYNGDLNMVKFIHKNGVTNSPIYIDYASMNGYLNVVRYLHSMGFEWNPLTSMNHACIHGHIEVVRYLDKIGARCSIMAMNLAIANGHLEVVKFLKDTGHTYCMESALLQAKIRNKDDIMVVLNESNMVRCKKSVSKLSVYRFSPLLIVVVFILLVTHYIIKN
jgi:hypothetical protein